MAVEFDRELTSLAAEILRDAVQVFDRSDIERWAVGYNPVLSGWGVTGSFPAVSGAFSTVTGPFSAVTGAFPALSGSFPAVSGAFPALSTSFPAVSGSFPALGGQAADAEIRLKKVFKLPRTLPAVRLPSSAELAAAARSAPLMTKLDALARWLGRDGRLVTEKDDLSAADAADAARWVGVRPEYLPYLWEYALVTGWFELEDETGGSRTWAVLGQAAWRWADGDDSGALHVWAAVFATVLALTLDVTAASDPGASRKLEFLGQGVVVAVMLFLARRSGLSRADVRDLVVKCAVGDRPSPRVRRAWDNWVHGHGDPARWLLGELAALCAVTVPDTDDGVVGLTPLALWALREQLRLEGVEIPLLTATPAQMTAAELVALADSVSEAEFEAEFASWMAARDPDRAARQLLAFAAFTSPRPRLAAVNLVRRLGGRAHMAWRDAMQRPELRGYARIALSMLAAELPESTIPLVLNPDPDDLTWVATDLLALACGDDDPDPRQIADQFREAVPQGEQTWIFSLMSRSSHPDVARVLAVLGRHHPDRRVAKAARKAARAAKNRAPARADRVPARAAAR